MLASGCIRWAVLDPWENAMPAVNRIIPLFTTSEMLIKMLAGFTGFHSKSPHNKDCNIVEEKRLHRDRSQMDTIGLHNETRTELGGIFDL